MNLEDLFALLNQYGPVMLRAIQNRGYDPGIIGETIQNDVDLSNFNTPLNENDDALGALIHSVDDDFTYDLARSELVDPLFGVPDTSYGNEEYSLNQLRNKLSKTPGSELRPVDRYLKQMYRRNMFDE